MTFHIQLATERRTEPERMAISMSDQLHMTNCETLNHPDDSNIIGIFEWDQKSPYVLQHKGDWSSVNCRGAGWPEMTKEQWVSQQADQMGVS